MKKLFTISVILFIISCAAMLDKIPEEDLRVQKVFEVDLNKGEIYSSSVQWMAKTFVDSKEVIEVKDAENGRLIGKGITEFRVQIIQVPCRYTMTIEAKDNKVRITFDNFVGLWGKYHNQPRAIGKYKGERGYLEEIKNKLNILADDLNNHLNKTKADSDW